MEGLSDVRNLVKKDGVVAFTELRADAGKIGLESVLKEIDKLKQLRTLRLSKDILAGLSPKLIKRFRQRAATESPWELRHIAWDVR